MISRENVRSLQSIIQANLPNARGDSFLAQLPNGFYYAKLPRMDQLPEPLIIQEKPVKQLILCIEAIENKENKSLGEGSAALQILFQDGTVKTITLNPESRDQISGLFPSIEMTYQAMSDPAIPWSIQSMREVYDENKDSDPDKTYRELHQKIGEGVAKVIRQFGHCELIDVGTGDGKLPAALKALFANKILCVGVDINKKNIEHCRQEYKQCRFLVGNSLNLDEIIKDLKHENMLSDSGPLVLTASGSLTRVVLNDGFEAARVLQKANLSQVQYIIGGGHTPPLFNEFIAKQIGYEKKEMPDYPADGKQRQFFYFYEKMPMEIIIEKKLNKMAKRNFLDLSLCPNPVDILNALMEKKAINENLTIDISFCQLTDELLDQLQAITQKIPGIKLVYWYADEDRIKTSVPNVHWKDGLNKLQKRFSSQVPLRLKSVTQDGYLMSSRRFFSSLHDLQLFSQPKEEVKMPKEEIKAPLMSRGSQLFSPSPASKEITTLEDFILNNDVDQISDQVVLDYVAKLLNLPNENEESIDKRISPIRTGLNLEGNSNEEIKASFNRFIAELTNRSINNKEALLDLLFIYKKGLSVVLIENRGYNTFTKMYDNKQKLNELIINLKNTTGINPAVINKLSKWALQIEKPIPRFV